MERGGEAGPKAGFAWDFQPRRSLGVAPSVFQSTFSPLNAPLIDLAATI